MTDFMAKMHQIRFRLGLRPRPRWGSLQRSPDPLAGFGGLLLREGEGRGREGKGGRGRGGEERGRGERREGRGEREREERRGERRGGEGSVPIVPVLRNDHCPAVLLCWELLLPTEQ